MAQLTSSGKEVDLCEDQTLGVHTHQHKTHCSPETLGEELSSSSTCAKGEERFGLFGLKSKEKKPMSPQGPFSSLHR